MRRLLLTAASVPANGADKGPSLLHLRAERLWAMGELAGLSALLKAAPAALRTPELARLEMDALWLAGDTGAACALAGPAAAAAPGDAALTKAKVLCRFLAGQTLEANLALDLLRERKDPDAGSPDTVFIAAAETLGGLPPIAVDKLPNPTPLHLAALRAARMPLPADVAATTHPAVLKAIALSPNAPVEARLAAAEKVLDPAALRQVFGAVTVAPAELASPRDDRTARGRAVMFRAALQEAQAGARAELIARALKGASERGAFTGAARLDAPLIGEIRPDGVLSAFAPVLSRALYAAGHGAEANSWAAIARANPETAKAAAALWPLARLVDPADGKTAPDGVLAAWRTARELPADQAERRAAVVLGMLAEMGEPIPEAEWLAVLDGPLLHTAGGPQPRPALARMLEAAVQSMSLGETVLLSLVSIGETGLDRLDPGTLVRVVGALKALGLDREARDLAVEAALANGV